MSVAVLLRCFRNPEAGRVVERLGRLGPVTRVVVASAPDRDRVDTRAMVTAADCPAVVGYEPVADWAWARALNRCLMRLDADGATEPWVLCVSAEVGLCEHHLTSLVARLSAGDASCAWVTFAGRTEISYRVPRNTCCLWPRALLSELGGFDERGDDGGGMEDYALALTAHQQASLLPALAVRGVPIVTRPGEEIEARVVWEICGMVAAERRHAPDTVAAVHQRLGI